MSTADIKDVLIEKVKGLKKKEAALFYGRIIEEENFSDEDFFKTWADVPAEHKKKIEAGIKDIENGQSKNFDSFATSFKRKHQVKP